MVATNRMWFNLPNAQAAQAENLQVTGLITGPAVPVLFVVGNPNGVVLGRQWQMAIDAAAGTLYQCTASPTTWAVWTAPGGGAGGLLAIQTFTASGTYTPTVGAKGYRLRMSGGGGGGGGCPITAGRSAAGGGASGVWWEKEAYLGVQLTGGAVVIGAAGVKGFGTAGANGGDSSCIIQATTYTASGGAGGPIGVNFTVPEIGIVGQTATGTTTTGAGITFACASGVGGAVGTTTARGGEGGEGPYGFGGFGGFGNGASANVGQDAIGRGGGGGGASAIATGGTTNGGAGTAGIVIVEEYA